MMVHRIIRSQNVVRLETRLIGRWSRVGKAATLIKMSSVIVIHVGLVSSVGWMKVREILTVSRL